MSVLLACEVSDGRRTQEATVKVVGADGGPDFVPIDRSILISRGRKTYRPVDLVIYDREHGRAQVGLPVEADSGARRMWVKLEALRDLPEGAPA